MRRFLLRFQYELGWEFVRIIRVWGVARQLDLERQFNDPFLIVGSLRHDESLCILCWEFQSNCPFLGSGKTVSLDFERYAGELRVLGIVGHLVFVIVILKKSALGRKGDQGYKKLPEKNRKELYCSFKKIMTKITIPGHSKKANSQFLSPSLNTHTISMFPQQNPSTPPPKNPQPIIFIPLQPSLSGWTSNLYIITDFLKYLMKQIEINLNVLIHKVKLHVRFPCSLIANLKICKLRIT